MFVYIASSPQDREFVQRLSHDLQKANIAHWYNDGASEETQYANLNKATHVILALSPAVLLEPVALAALEHARQKRLIRLALRVAAVETLPPQMQGVLPLDCTSDEAYADSLDTLFDDLRPTLEIKPQLPNDIMTGLYSQDSDERQKAINTLGEYRTERETLRELARDELRALIFREQDAKLKSLGSLVLKSFDAEVVEEAPAPPSKEELAIQAEQSGASLYIRSTRIAYLWETGRWYLVLGGLAFTLALVMFLVSGGVWAYWLPMVTLGFVLPWFNVFIRQGGEYDWTMPGPLIGNIILSLAFAGGIATIFLLVDIFTLVAVAVTLALALMYGVLVGWLSSIRFEVPV